MIAEGVNTVENFDPSSALDKTAGKALIGGSSSHLQHLSTSPLISTTRRATDEGRQHVRLGVMRQSVSFSTAHSARHFFHSTGYSGGHKDLHHYTHLGF
ncbi:hypothetical protein Pmani_038114 [Petrolisthes manimaculis]|uniref:Uncharacterized protein n=1 Tax=Petrolisthes manimaculis TaxID=1843537 RepID=A0AAE1NF07_9EUCA|nr:hypothetical protein Pmani_038114 [Petrolisthes manimaculis]